MNYILEAEKYLWHYRDLKQSLGQLDREISKLKWSGAPELPSAQEIDDMPHGKAYQDDMMNIAFKLQLCMESRGKTLQELNEIDQLLDEISQEQGCEDYGKVLQMWYVGKNSKEEIAEVLNYSQNSRQSIYDIRNKAIRKFAIRKFGLEALKAI